MIKLDKPFVGRDALAAQAEQRPGRTLVGLRGSGRRAARAGYPVLSPDRTVVGVVTSGALSPTLSHPIALGYVDTGLAVRGTELAIDVRGRAEPYQVVTPPFYRR